MSGLEDSEAWVSSGDDAIKSGSVSRVLESDDGSNAGSELDIKEEKVKQESSRVFGVKNERKTPPSFVQFDLQNDPFTPRDDEFDDDDDGVKNDVDVKGNDVEGEVYNSLLSEFDDYVANEKHGAIESTSRALSYGFEVGDMVWGKVKSHPWWPGHIFNEAFATSSVRRTRREGYVLVAFFGDSSYGWFDPAELIPFDENYAEKSLQTTSRTFVKAVEEAVDEVSRRCGLGVTCRCRNKYNFRPTNVQGYFEVDIPDYEARGVYSAAQIKKAQHKFQPNEALAFVKQLASSPKEFDSSAIDFIKNRSTVFAFRRALFEEFDETYAQAFGVQSKRSASDQANTLNHPKVPARAAPLSGPLVIAETLSGGKSSKKAVKVKEHSKKDQYLIKRRDEPVDSNTTQSGQLQTNSSAEGSSVGTSDYVLQKRAPPLIQVKNEHRSNSKETGGLTQDSSGKVILDQISTSVTNSFDKEIVASEENKGKMVSEMAVDPSEGWSKIVSPAVQQEGESMVDVKYGDSARMPGKNEGSLQTESFPARPEGDDSFDKSDDASPGMNISPTDAKRSIGTGAADVKVKKEKAPKRPLGNLSPEDSAAKGKKKKKKKDPSSETSPDLPKNKKKKDPSSETSPDLPKKKRLATGTGGASVGKSKIINVAPKEDSQVQEKDISTSNVGSIGSLPVVGMGNIDHDLQHLLSDLRGLAVDPFHGSERSSPSITVQFFLRVRASSYQKSLLLSPPPPETESDTRATKSSATPGASDPSTGENNRDLPPSRPMKSVVRSDDVTKVGRKRLPSDRQEEIAAKKLKKFNQVKLLTAEKKRSLETHRTEGKEPAVTAPPKSVKFDSVRKMEPLSKAVQPTMLVMKFPPETTLPSVNQLKAKFARFGSIDLSAIRVFWQSFTCRVVFKHKLDAQAAFRYAVGNKSLFGPDMNVKYSLREVGAPASEAPESEKGREETSVEVSRAKDLASVRQPPAHQSMHQTAVQPKSILKKPTGDEAGQVTGGKGTARVKFILGGEESTTSSRGEQLMGGTGNRNFNNNASFADGGASTSVAMDFNSKNFQKVIPPPSSSAPILPLPTQFSKPPLNNTHHSEVAPPRNMHNLNPPFAPPRIHSAPSIDISQQMLSLLTRCNDVVTTVTGLLGYVPYHPL